MRDKKAERQKTWKGDIKIVARNKNIMYHPTLDEHSFNVNVDIYPNLCNQVQVKAKDACLHCISIITVNKYSCLTCLHDLDIMQEPLMTTFHPEMSQLTHKPENLMFYYIILNITINQLNYPHFKIFCKRIK